MQIFCLEEEIIIEMEEYCRKTDCPFYANCLEQASGDIIVDDTDDEPEVLGSHTEEGFQLEFEEEDFVYGDNEEEDKPKTKKAEPKKTREEKIMDMLDEIEL